MINRYRCNRKQLFVCGPRGRLIAPVVVPIQCEQTTPAKISRVRTGTTTKTGPSWITTLPVDVSCGPAIISRKTIFLKCYYRYVVLQHTSVNPLQYNSTEKAIAVSIIKIIFFSIVHPNLMGVHNYTCQAFKFNYTNSEL